MHIQNIISGYVCVSIEGFYIEKVINVCKKNGVGLINLNRKSNTLIYAGIKIGNFRELARIARKNHCRIKILKKVGVPFLLNKYKKRKIFAIALILFCVVTYSLSKFIWNIEIVGNEDISQDTFINIANEEGLNVGKLKSKVDLDKIINRIRMEIPDVSWVGIKISGTNARIEVVKSDEIPNIVDESEYCNIVATKDAMIESASAQNGTLQVKKGDIVKKGSVLVAGFMEGKYTGIRYVHSTGAVIGKVWYTESARVYYKQTKRTQTGKKENKYSIKVSNFVINFSKKLSKFEIYDTIRTDKKLKISSNFYLPFQFEKNTNYEVIEEETEYTVDEAKEQAINEAKTKIKQHIGNNEDIINEYINTDESEEYIDVEVTYEVLENIGTEEKIAL